MVLGCRVSQGENSENIVIKKRGGVGSRIFGIFGIFGISGFWACF